MIEPSTIEKINNVIKAYFEKNPSITIVPAKELMQDFIEAGIFQKDFKNGKPIREVLRELDKNNKRELIPFVHAELKDNNKYWYFIPENSPTPTTPYKQVEKISKKETTLITRSKTDISYVIDLCDNVLELKAERQKRFNFLLGDLHKDGFKRTKLPVNAYYENYNLVIEYKEPRLEVTTNSEDSENLTISGVTREEQRKIYDLRRATELPKNGIKFIEIPYHIFECDSEGKIIRNEEDDLKMILAYLKKERFYSNIKMDDAE